MRSLMDILNSDLGYYHGLSYCCLVVVRVQRERWGDFMNKLVKSSSRMKIGSQEESEDGFQITVTHSKEQLLPLYP